MRCLTPIGIGALSLAGMTLPSINQSGGEPPQGRIETALVERASEPQVTLDDLIEENQHLRRTLEGLGEFRLEVESRYTKVEEGRHTLLAEHRRILREDADMLKACEAESADITSRLLLKLELLRERQEILQKEHERLTRRKEGLEADYEAAKKAHKHLEKRYAGEMNKISGFEARIPDYEAELRKATEERDNERSDWYSRWWY